MKSDGTRVTLTVALLARKRVLPRYDSVIVCLPSGRLVVLSVALPPDRLTVPRSSLVVVSKKSTLPVGVAVLGALVATVAVKVSAWPKYWVPEIEPAVVVPAALTVWVRAVLVLVMKLVSPA
jgi:hypothetical protein